MKVKEEVGAVEGVIDSGLRQPRNTNRDCAARKRRSRLLTFFWHFDTSSCLRPLRRSLCQVDDFCDLALGHGAVGGGCRVESVWYGPCGIRKSVRVALRNENEKL